MLIYITNTIPCVTPFIIFYAFLKKIIFIF